MFITNTDENGRFSYGTITWAILARLGLASVFSTQVLKAHNHYPYKSALENLKAHKVHGGLRESQKKTQFRALYI